MQEQKTKPPCVRCMKTRAKLKRAGKQMNPMKLTHHFKRNKK